MEHNKHSVELTSDENKVRITQNNHIKGSSTSSPNSGKDLSEGVKVKSNLKNDKNHVEDDQMAGEILKKGLDALQNTHGINISLSDNGRKKLTLKIPIKQSNETYQERKDNNRNSC